MPPKKRGNLGRSTPIAKARRVSRTDETEEEADARRESARLRIAEVRQAETPDETERRLETARVRIAELRSSEKQGERARRLETKRARFTETISEESSDQKERRLQVNRQRIANARNARFTNWENSAFSYSPTIKYQTQPLTQIGSMTEICQSCSAAKFPREPPRMCCSGGKVRLPEIEEPPEPLKSLLTGTSAESKHFLRNIRQYNSCFQMTSFGAEEVRLPGYFPTFKVCGQVYHLAGSILPPPGEDHKFLQIYFMGGEEIEADRRCAIINDVRRSIVLKLQQMLHEKNNIMKDFKTAMELATPEELKVKIHADRVPSGEHERRYNAPVMNDVAIVIVGQEFNRRDIILHSRQNGLQRISDTNRLYDPL